MSAAAEGAGRALTPAELEDLLEPFIRQLGIRDIAFSPQQGRVELKLAPQHLNRFGLAHGGVIMTLLDFVMAQSCRAADPERRPAVTIEMKTAFVQPGRGALRCTGHCVHRSGSLAFGEARVLDESETLVAFGSGTFKYVKE
jgi:uncharacterized protein (TIGR00369 family)